jgi:ferredoxin
MGDEPVMTKYKVVVDQNKCIGAGSCVAAAALTFRLNEANKSEIIDQDGNSDEEKLLAAQTCPTGAIMVIDTVSGQKVWPK